MLNKQSLEIAALVSNEESRFTLNGILVTPTATVETDGHQLIRITRHPGDVSQFPQCFSEGTPTVDFKPFLLPKKDALEIAKAIPNTKAQPILEHAVVIKQTDEVVTLATTDLERARVFPVRKMTGNFPDYERVIPRLADSTYAISFNPVLLSRTLAAVGKFLGKSKTPVCTLHFGKDHINGDGSITNNHGEKILGAKAVRIEAKNDEGQVMTAVIMPMRNEALVCPQYERQLSALAYAERFMADIAAELAARPNEEHPGVPYDSMLVQHAAALYGKLERLFKATEPQPEPEPIPIPAPSFVAAAAQTEEIEGEEDDESPAPVTTVPVPAASGPIVLGEFRYVNQYVYENGVQVAHVIEKEDGKAVAGVANSYTGDKAALKAFALEKFAVQKKAEEAALAAAAREKQNNLRVMPTPGDQSGMNAAQKAWETRRARAAGVSAPAATPSKPGKQPSVKQQLVQAASALAQVLGNLGIPPVTNNESEEEAS